MHICAFGPLTLALDERTIPVRNEFNIAQLRQRILGALPGALSGVGERAVEAFLALEGISMWRPARLGVLQLSFVFDIGLPFALIGENPSAKPLAMRAGDTARDGRYPEPDVWRVVHAGALLSHWGAAINFVTDAASTSVRLEVALPDSGTLEVQVRPNGQTGCEESKRARLIVIDARGTHGALEQILQSCAVDLESSPAASGVLVFEPRFWVGVQQKEWIHQSTLNPSAAVPIAAAMLGNADAGRQALRLTLLE